MIDLFDAAAERIAYESGRALSQVRAEITNPEASINDLPLFESEQPQAR